MGGLSKLAEKKMTGSHKGSDSVAGIAQDMKMWGTGRNYLDEKENIFGKKMNKAV